MVGVKTNPFRDWRTFIAEIAIIVVGVLIALLAQQMADSRNWDAQVRDARESMDGQLAGAMFAARERVGTADCIEQQLARLEGSNRVQRILDIGDQIFGFLDPDRGSRAGAAGSNGRTCAPHRAC